jgi:type IV pilus assembly protein PilN
VNLIQVVQRGDRIELEGVAQSSTRVSALMRNIDDSDWLREPGLDIVEARSAGVDRNSQFKLFARQISMVSPDGDAAAPAPAARTPAQRTRR